MSDAFGVPKPPVPPAPGPRLIHDGLAVYARGTGEPLFLMPYPHGFTSGPITEDSLATLLKGLGHCVVSFDPPGAHASTRPPRVDMPEMLSCATEALDALHIQGPVDTVGHSMGGLCALALAINRPERVRRLVLVGSGSGGPSLRRHRAMPWNWSLVSLDFWRYAFWGTCLLWRGGTLAAHKHVERLVRAASYVDTSRVPAISIAAADRHRPAPVRDRWPRTALRLDYGPQLGEVRAPTLVCAGRYDPQFPLGCGWELARGIPGARMVVFERSGHYPHEEEPVTFAQVMAEFLHAQADPVPAAALPRSRPRGG